jgi:hypothetical protein
MITSTLASNCTNKRQAKPIIIAEIPYGGAIEIGIALLT